MFDPKVCDHLSEEDLSHYLNLACSAIVKGGFCNKEYALHVLCICNGNIEKAVLTLMVEDPKLPQGHPLLTYVYPENDVWSSKDVKRYHEALVKFDKDFNKIAKDMGMIKTVKQCVEFYYLWKKVCPDEYKRLRIIRKKREQDDLLYNLRSRTVEDQHINCNSPATISSSSGLSLDICLDSPQEALSDHGNHSIETKDMITKHTCDFPGCKASFLSSQALLEHLQDHSISGPNVLLPNAPKSLTNRKMETQAHIITALSNEDSSSATNFPCKVCGKVFAKIRSRSAHMKTHRQHEEYQTQYHREASVSAAFATTNVPNLALSSTKDDRTIINSQNKASLLVENNMYDKDKLDKCFYHY